MCEQQLLMLQGCHTVDYTTSDVLRGSSCSLTGTITGCCLRAHMSTSPSWMLHSIFQIKLQRQ